MSAMALLFAGVITVEPVTNPQAAKPNILFVLSDDQRADSLSCMPKLKEELRSKGVTFSHYFASTPLCCPARTTLGKKAKSAIW